VHAAFGLCRTGGTVDEGVQLVVAALIGSGCHAITPDAGQEAVLVKKPLISEAMVAYIKQAGLPLTLIDVTVGRANPPDSVKNQHIATAEQGQRGNTERLREGRLHLHRRRRRPDRPGSITVVSAFRRTCSVRLQPDQEDIMILVTTPTVSGHRIEKTHGLVSGEAILGAHIFRDIFAGITNIVGGRSAAYEEELRKAKTIALDEMQQQAREFGGNAVVGVDLDYETIGQGASMLMVSASGTAVTITPE
jgi:uncharacterized protein YbjQ (UPF0145 family)